MKTKAKLTLAISAMSAVVLAAGVTSTFAWFTTQSIVTVNYANININAPTSLELYVHQFASSVRAATPSDNKTNYSGDPVVLGSVSSADGLTFYAPTTLGDNTAAAGKFTAVNGAETLTNNKYTQYLFYQVTVVAKAGTAAQKLQAKFTITASGAPLTGWWRFRMFEIAAPSSNIAVSTRASSKLSGGIDLAYASADVDDDYPITSTAGAVTTSAVEYDATPTGQVPLTSSAWTSASEDVRKAYAVCAWMEGTLSDEQNTAGGQTMTVKIDFSLFE